MAVNLTFAGRAYADKDVLSWAYAYEQQAKTNRQPPKHTPALEHRTWHSASGKLDSTGENDITIDLKRNGDKVVIRLTCPTAARVSITSNGSPVDMQHADGSFIGEAPALDPPARRPGEIANPEWTQAMVIAVVEHGSGIRTGKVAHVS
jgi:amidase